MKTPVFLSAFMGLPAFFLTPLAVAYASPLPPDRVHFCQPVDPDQLNLHQYPPAAKRLQDLNVGEPRTVRLFYFLPNDRPYRTEVVDSLKSGILDLQTFFADQTETHGHGRKTFDFETDDQGDPIVHRVDGDSSDSHYSSRGYTEGEIKRAFDNSANIILIVMDVSARSVHGVGTGSKGSGWAMIYGEWNWFAAAHELGHSFGLHHDFRDNEYIMSYGRADRASAKLSPCAAKFLAANPYFNSDVPLQNESSPTVQLVSSPEYPFGSASMPVQLRVRDDDGLHQLILFVMPKNPFLGGTPEVKACHGLSAETDTVVEFNFDGRLPSDNVGTSPEAHTTLSNTVQHRIHVIAVDTDGNRNNIPNSDKQFNLEAGHSRQHIATVDRPYYYDIGGMAISHDGSHLAIGTGGIVELMDAAERERITDFRHTEGNRYTNWSVAFSQDGTLLASGSANGTIKVWNVNTREEAASLDGHTGQVLALDFSPDGTLLASGSRDNTVKLWDVTTWTNTATLEGHTDGIVSLDFLPGGKLATKSWRDGTVRLWDVQTRSQNSTINTDAVGTVALSPDGATLASSISWAIKLWSLSTGVQTGALNHMREYNYAQLAFSPDGTILAVTANGLIEIWDVLTRELLATIPGGPGGVGRILFSPNGKQLIGTADKGIKFWDVSEWTAPIGAVSQRTSQVREAILGVVRLDHPNVSSYAEITETHLAGITALFLNDRGITSLKTGDFDGLSGLEELRLWGNQLTSLPEDIFSGLSSLATLRFGLNQLTTLPAGLLEGLTTLTDVRMIGNQLTTLPDGIFEGLTGLSRLALQSNSVDPLPLNVSLQLIGKGQFKAVAPTGAPFALVFPLIVGSGSINGGATTITIPAGSVESDTLTVTRTPGTTFAVTVDIGTLPSLPANHFGYTLVTSADLPLKVIDPLAGGVTPVCDRTPQVRDAIVAAVSGISSCGDVTEAHLSATTVLDLQRKGITALKAGDFDGLNSLIRLWLRYNELSTLPVDIFDGLTSLTTLYLNSNKLTSFPSGIFDGLTELRDLHLSDNGLTSLPGGIFGGLTELKLIWLRDNALTSLPAGIFHGLSEPLIELEISGNTVNPLPLTVFLEKVGTNQFKAAAPSGVPFDIVLPLTISNGSITSGASTLTIPVGSVGSEILTVTRIPGTTFAVSVNIGDPLPVLPGRHQGYGLVKSTDLPLAFPELGGAAFIPVCDRTPQVRDEIVAAVSGVSNCRNVTEAHLAAITNLYFQLQNIKDLKTGDFDGLTALTHLNLAQTQLSTLPPDIFRGLSALTWIRLDNNQLSSLPADIFDGLALESIQLHSNQLSSLPTDVFDGLTALTSLTLGYNQLSIFPDGIFEGLTALRTVRLVGNTIDPFPLTVSLEKVADGQFKAVIPTGAPFDIVLPLSVSNGSISNGITTATISTGSVESETLTVTRTPGTTVTVTVNIGTLPTVPRRGIGRQGYVLEKSPDLPLEVIDAVTGPPATTDFNGDGKTDFVDFFLFADAYGGTDARFDLDGSGTVDFVDFFQFVDSFDQPGQAKLLALAQEMLGLPAGPQLQQNAPNPFNSETVISWFLLEPGPARLEVFGLTGQRVAILHQGPLKTGFHRIHWDGRDDAGRALASGVYLYRLVGAETVLTQKLTLLR